MTHFFLDTCAINHIRELQTNISLDLRKHLLQYRLGLTSAVLKEWNHYSLDIFLDPTNCYHIPIQNEYIDQMLQKYPFFSDFDLADQSLIYVAIFESAVIISDDGALNAAIVSINRKALFLPDLCIQFIKTEILNKKEMMQMLRFWKKVGRYNKQMLKRWEEKLMQI